MMYKKVLFAITPLLLLLSVLGIAELWLRGQERTEQEVEFLFFTEFKISRWKYLNKLRDRLLIDQVLETEPYSTHIDPPEANRPPFDRVPYPYEVRYNNLGFRDTDFTIQPKKKKRVLVLGDSVSFGKGVDVEERFSNILQEKRPDLEIWNLGLQGCTAECMAKLLDKNIIDMNPDLLIIQASGNDIDQTLWKVATQQQISAMSIEALKWVRTFRVLEYWVHMQGQEGLKRQLAQAHSATSLRYGEDLLRLFSWADSQSIPIISLNLPFAHGYHYGKHQSNICAQFATICIENIEMDFSMTDREREQLKADEPLEYVDFVQASAKEFSLKEQSLAEIFTYRASFHDVCHLSPIGHRQVANTLLPLLKGL